MLSEGMGKEHLFFALSPGCGTCLKVGDALTVTYVKSHNGLYATEVSPTTNEK